MLIFNLTYSFQGIKKTNQDESFYVEYFFVCSIAHYTNHFNFDSAEVFKWQTINKINNNKKNGSFIS